jgi:hypothetical protein
LKNLNNITRAYVAGFFDGEGTILMRNMRRYSKKYSTYYYPQVSVVNTHKPIIKYIQKLFGGRIELKSKHEKRLGRKKLWDLRFRRDESINLLNAIQKYLIIKKENAKIVLEFLNMPKKLKRDWHGRLLKISKYQIKKRKNLFRRYKNAQKVGRSY